MSVLRKLRRSVYRASAGKAGNERMDAFEAVAKKELERVALLTEQGLRAANDKAGMLEIALAHALKKLGGELRIGKSDELGDAEIEYEKHDHVEIFRVKSA